MPQEDWGLDCSGVLAWLEATTLLDLLGIFSQGPGYMLPIVHSSALVGLPDNMHPAGLSLNLPVLPAVPGLPFQFWTYLL